MLATLALRSNGRLVPTFQEPAPAGEFSSPRSRLFACPKCGTVMVIDARRRSPLAAMSGVAFSHVSVGNIDFGEEVRSVELRQLSLFAKNRQLCDRL
jgi:hypothetical protein